MGHYRTVANVADARKSVSNGRDNGSSPLPSLRRGVRGSPYQRNGGIRIRKLRRVSGPFTALPQLSRSAD